eukprot:748519-Hanusia_phi.AAC.1
MSMCWYSSAASSQRSCSQGLSIEEISQRCQNRRTFNRMMEAGTEGLRTIQEQLASVGCQGLREKCGMRAEDANDRKIEREPVVKTEMQGSCMMTDSNIFSSSSVSVLNDWPIPEFCPSKEKVFSAMQGVASDDRASCASCNLCRGVTTMQ